MLTFLVHSFNIGVGTFLKSKNLKIKVVLADPQVRRLHHYYKRYHNNLLGIHSLAARSTYIQFLSLSLTYTILTQCQVHMLTGRT